MSTIAVIGCGHVGVVVAAGFAELGHRVVGVDKSEARVAALNAGDVPFHEPGLPELIASGRESGRLAFTTSYEDAVPDAKFIFLAVDTPSTAWGAADLANIRSAARSIAGSLNGTRPIIVNKSTSPIGTGETIEAILRHRLFGLAHPPAIVSNPEFLRQGLAVQDFFNPDRVVIGARSKHDAEAVAALYEGLGGTLLMTDLRTAEMIKYVANSFLATRVSFINEIARLCELLGVDVDEVVDGVGHDPRVGRHFFHPGIGFGGSCLPKDVAALRYMGEAFGVATPLLSAVQEINQAQRTSAVRKLRSALGSLDGKRIGVWGVTFKGGTEDARESPAVDVIGLLMNEGAEITTYDPAFPTLAPERIRETFHKTPLEAARGVDALAILTDWDEFSKVSLEDLRDVMAGNVIFDGRNVLQPSDAKALGFVYIGVGRGRLPVAVAVDDRVDETLAPEAHSELIALTPEVVVA